VIVIEYLDQLQSWYHSQCDGDWEHDERIRIKTLENSDWHLTINIEGTECESISFQTIKFKTDDMWYHCFVERSKFEAICGSYNLGDVLRIFCDWAEECREINNR
jgi:hypothetical protein